MDERRIDAADRLLLRIVDSGMAGAARAGGDHLVCRPGCTECCIGPFPITQLDARRLRQGLATLEGADPGRAARVRERARAAAGAMPAAYPGEESEESFAARYESVPCPALDPGTGLCDLYSARPLACRTFGPPVCLGSEDLPPCRLCFTDASAAEVEACRVAVDPDGVEVAVLEESGLGGLTIIAFALCGDHPGC